jgi:sugar-specific transcriptional regulator TrmB
MDAKTLEKFGLTEGEAKVYLALLRIGKSTIGNIIKEAHVSNSKVYNILDRLSKKGLIGIVTENNRKSFEAKSPEMLKENLQEAEKELENKKKKLNSILPSLKGIFEAHEVKQEAEILQGIRGIKAFTERLLKNSKKGDTIYILGSPREAGAILEGYYTDWHKRRIKKGIKCKIIYNSEAKKYAKTRKKLKLADVRILPPEIITPVAIDFNNEEVGTLVFGKSPFCFAVKNIEIANNYKKYFGLLWKISKE